MATVVVIGTCDTKLDELLFIRKEIKEFGIDINVILIDVGRNPTEHEAIDISQTELLKQNADFDSMADLPRAEVIATMGNCAMRTIKKLFDQGSIHGIIAAGGSGGTSLASEVMRNALPIGFPKLIVSTVASGDTGPIVEETDITLMYSVVDIAGLNQVLRNVLRNAAVAIAAMARSYASRSEAPVSVGKQRVGITMFGVTTPAVDAIRAHLESNYDIEVYVFHATGHGGKAMERLIREGGLDAVLDLTTTEICDMLTGGVMSAGHERLQAAAKAGIPNVISVGATDMTNFGPMKSVPERYKQRKLYEHNPMVTLMRSSEEESQQIGEYIGDTLKRFAKDPSVVQVWLPRGGVSMISTPGGPFEDKNADEALFTTLTTGLADTGIKIVDDERAINDPGFAKDIGEALASTMCITRRTDQ